MSNVVRFPGGHRVAARAIPRQEFERLAELALDVVERIITLLDDDGAPDDGFSPPRPAETKGGRSADPIRD